MTQHRKSPSLVTRLGDFQLLQRSDAQDLPSGRVVRGGNTGIDQIAIVRGESGEEKAHAGTAGLVPGPLRNRPDHFDPGLYGTFSRNSDANITALPQEQRRMQQHKHPTAGDILGNAPPHSFGGVDFHRPLNRKPWQTPVGSSRPFFAPSSKSRMAQPVNEEGNGCQQQQFQGKFHHLPRSSRRLSIDDLSIHQSPLPTKQ